MKIVTAAIAQRDGVILLTRRAPDQKLAGYWEFPGGKLEDGESLQECLQRELHEELGVESTVGEVLCESVYEYQHGAIRLIALATKLLSYDFSLTVHDRAEWAEPRKLTNYKLAPADIPIAEFLERTPCEY